MDIAMAHAGAGLVIWPYEGQHQHNTRSLHGKFREGFNGSIGNRRLFVGFKRNQSGQGTFISTHTLACTSTAVESWERLVQFYSGNGINKGLSRLCREGRLKEALDILSRFWADAYTYVSLLQACASMKALLEGKQIHAHLLKNGFEQNSLVENKLVVMYAKCGSLVNARKVFDKTAKRNMLSWPSLIGACARHQQWEEALALFYQMQSEGMRVDNFVIPSIIKACAGLTALDLGKEIHGYVVRTGFELDVFVGNALVDMYAKCGRTEDACHVFNKMSQKDVVSWTAIISGYAQAGRGDEALKLYHEMELAGVKPDIITWNAMITGFAQNGHIEEALKVLDRMQLSGVKPEVNSWNAIIAGCAQNGYGDEALKLFHRMQLEDVKPNSVTIPSVLPACADLGALRQGREIHGHIIKSRIESNAFVESALVNMYVKCGSIDDARQVFDGVMKRNVALWNAMIAGYAQNGYAEEALKLFSQMQLSSVKPDAITWNAMIAGYAKNGYGDEALKFFFQMQLAGVKPKVISWNALIAGFVQSGHGNQALKVFRQMQVTGIIPCMDSCNGGSAEYAWNSHGNTVLELFPQMHLAGMKPNSVTIASVLSACANLSALQQGKEIHGYTVRNGFESNVFVGSALVDMYAKCQCIDDAHNVFDNMSQRNVVSWNIMIAGYARVGHGYDTLKLFRQMLLAGVKPNSVTIVGALSACTNLIALQKGKEIHGYITRSGIESDVFVKSSLVDMYAKCGSIVDAHQVFERAPQRDVVVCNAMIAGYAMHGHVEDALTLFDQMKQWGIKPDHITLTAILSACSHAGIVDKGWQYLNCMCQDYGITPTLEHYTCMVKLLGRAGHLYEAYNFINKMPLEPDAYLWGTLLGACRMHCNLELGDCIAKCLFELEPENARNYMLLLNIYAAVGRWDAVENIRKMMKERGLKTQPACSWIEVNRMVHAFVVGDNSHPEMEKIFATLKSLAGQMEEKGYAPDINFVQQDVEGEEQEQIFCGHTEKLAIAFGLMNTYPWTPIRVIKNLRMCGDCHTSAKFISQIVGQEIFVRDTNHFHHFKDGVCSCGDYW